MNRKLKILMVLISWAAVGIYSAERTCTSEISTVTTMGYNGLIEGDLVLTTKIIGGNCPLAGKSFWVDDKHPGKSGILTHAISAANLGKIVSIKWDDADLVGSEAYKIISLSVTY